MERDGHRSSDNCAIKGNEAQQGGYLLQRGLCKGTQRPTLIHWVERPSIMIYGYAD